MTEALQLNNVRHFIWFRVFFNARFYYPVFTLLFLDYGLSLEQFAILNSVWALTIVLAEVPSGALADIVGRKRLVVFSATLMVIEMAVIGFIPLGNPNLIFWAFFVNRVLSGLAEAAASGADEALAFDSLKEKGLESAWPRVLERLMKVQAVAFFFAMNIGAAIYDPKLVSRLASLFSFSGPLTQDDVLRWPIWLTLITALVTLYHAARLIPLREEVERAKSGEGTIGQSFIQTWSTAKWIAHTPVVLVIILGGFVIDSVVRVFITLGSQYFRLIELPEAIYGLIFSAFSLVNFAMASVGKRLVEKRSAFFNFNVMAALAVVGLTGSAFLWRGWGLVPVFIAMSAMPLINFLLSSYLNTESPSKLRATILSFKGLALNLAYGTLGILYALLIAHIKGQLNLTGEELQDAAFAKSLSWLPAGFGVLYLSLLAGARLILLRPARRHLVQAP
jgi:MFS family permease